jgi:MraZ protein
VFLGRYEHTIDSKGRLAIPARYRPALERGLVVTRGIDRCLTIYPLAAWETLAEKVNALPLGDPNARALRRLFFAEASDAALDRQGRIIVPAALRAYAGLEEAAIVVGMNTSIEVWSPTRWAEQAAALEDDGSAIAEHLAGLI